MAVVILAGSLLEDGRVGWEVKPLARGEQTRRRPQGRRLGVVRGDADEVY